MKESVVATRLRRNIEQQFYAEEDEDDEEEEQTGIIFKQVTLFTFLSIGSMRTKWVIELNVFYFSCKT